MSEAYLAIILFSKQISASEEERTKKDDTKHVLIDTEGFLKSEINISAGQVIKKKIIRIYFKINVGELI